MQFSIDDIMDFGSVEPGVTIEEHAKSCYEGIGQYIIDHAADFAKGVTDKTAHAKIEIVIEPLAPITLKHEVKYYVTRKGKDDD